MQQITHLIRQKFDAANTAEKMELLKNIESLLTEYRYKLFIDVITQNSQTIQNEQSEINTDEGYYTTRDVMSLFQVTKPTVYRWVKDGTLTAVYAGTQYRFKKKLVNAYKSKLERTGTISRLTKS